MTAYHCDESCYEADNLAYCQAPLELDYKMWFTNGLSPQRKHFSASSDERESVRCICSCRGAEGGQHLGEFGERGL